MFNNSSNNDRDQQMLAASMRMMAAAAAAGQAPVTPATAAVSVGPSLQGLGPLCHSQFLPSWQEQQAAQQQHNAASMSSSQDLLSSHLFANMLQQQQHQQTAAMYAPAPAPGSDQWLLQGLKDALGQQQHQQQHYQPPPPVQHSLNLQELFQQVTSQAAHAQQTTPTFPPQDSVTDWIRAMMSNLVQNQNGGSVDGGLPPQHETPAIASDANAMNPYSSNTSVGDPSCDQNPSSHEQMWKTRYQELGQFHRAHGHSLVPMNYTPNPSLAHWVKRQRYQYKLKYGSNNANNSNNSTLTAEREAALRALDFVWDSHAASWEERYQELIQFKQEHGHANVPKHFPSNPKLSIWVKCQRRQYKLLLQKKKSNMTLDRFQKLQLIGFCFCPRGTVSGGRKNNTSNEPIPEELLKQLAGDTNSNGSLS